MTWIKMRTDLAEDPATIMVAAKTGLDEFAVVGRLHRLWAWADSQTSDGRIADVNGEWIDRYLQAPGFAAALVDAKWLSITTRGVRFPNFARHNGQSGKARAANTRRQQVLRGGRAQSATTARQKRDRTSRTGRASSATEARPEKIREEKRRREERRGALHARLLRALKHKHALYLQAATILCQQIAPHWIVRAMPTERRRLGYCKRWRR